MDRRHDPMMKNMGAVSFPCPYTRSKVQLRLLQVKLHREGGIQTLFILSSLKGHRLRKDGGEQGGPSLVGSGHVSIGKRTPT